MIAGNLYRNKLFGLIRDNYFQKTYFMILEKDLILPCRAILQNRIAKSAMSENMSPRHHGPTKPMILAYKRWAEFT